MADDPVLLSLDGAIATLTLNRPAALNALDEGMADALYATLVKVEHHKEVRCLVVRGAGDHFMAGGDVKGFKAQLDAEPDRSVVQKDIGVMIERVHRVILNMRAMPQPIVASVRGAVAGAGVSLMLACDMVLTADDAFFTLAEATEGGTPDRSTRPTPSAATILLVEDEAAIRAATALALHEHGYTVMEAADGEEALGIARHHGDAIDLVISDVVMPRLGGPELYRILMEEGLTLRFLFTTGYAADDAAHRLAPAVPVFYKPWSASELVDRIAALLADDPVSEA